MSLSQNEFIDWLCESCGLDRSEVAFDSLLEKDLGITGDDGTELLLAIEKDFNVNFTGEDGTIREAFELKEDEYLFHGEGFSSIPIIEKINYSIKSFFNITDSEEENVMPITVGQLYQVVKTLRG